MTDTITGLIYVGDPMCSWCWGFAPEIESLANEYPVEVVVGGLRPGPMAHEMDDRMALSLEEHWIEIAERTGQPFDTAFLERRDGWTYDTEPAAVAVTAMRLTHQPSTLSYFTAIQEAFYAKGEDVTDYEILKRLATAFPVDTAAFDRALSADDAVKRAWSDFSRARNWGISGFPTLVGRLADDRLALLANGWERADTIRARIESIPTLA